MTIQPTYAILASAARHTHSSGIRYRLMARDDPDHAHYLAETAERRIEASWGLLEDAREFKERFT